MQKLPRFFFDHLLPMFLCFANVTPTSASGDFFAIQADVQIGKLVLRNGAAAPMSIKKGQISQVTFIVQPVEAMADPPNAQPWGRRWDNSLIRTTFSAPLSLSFEKELVTQSDGLLAIDHDPLGNCDYSLRARLHSDGPAISDVAGREYRASQFTLMQHGHQDQILSVRDLISRIPTLPEAKLLVKFRTVRGSESWHTAAIYPTLSVIFDVSSLRFIEAVSMNEDSH